MEQFAGYGFNKSHSAAYAYLAFVTAYLKAHYPVDFMAALLTSETGNTAKVVKYINECREMGITVLPPDVNSSDWSFTPDDNEGKPLSASAWARSRTGRSGRGADCIVRAPKQRPFRSIYDFCENVDLGAVNRRMIESLIKAGAMDTLEGTRAQLFAVVDSAMEAGQRAWRDRESGQGGLFGEMLGAERQPTIRLPNVPDWTDKRKARRRKRDARLLRDRPSARSIRRQDLRTGHARYRQLWKASTEALKWPSAACSPASRASAIKTGKPWAAMQLEDRIGAVEALVFATQYDRLPTSLVEDKAVLVRAMVLPEDNAPPKLSVQDIVPLDVARVNLPSVISIRVRLGNNGNNGNDKAQALEELFLRKQGSTEVRLRIEKPRDFSVILDVNAKVRPDKEFKAEIERICGPESIEVLAT